MMIKERLIAIEKDVQSRIFEEQQNLEAIAMVKELMDQIDHDVEEVPWRTRLACPDCWFR